MSNELAGTVIRIFRYVDDFLVFGRHLVLEYVSRGFDVFTQNGSGLTFTHEVPQQNGLLFLDLKLTFEPDHVCWNYSPRSEKPLLN